MDTETLKEKTLIENDAVSLWYYPDLKIIHHKFHKFIMGISSKQC